MYTRKLTTKTKTRKGKRTMGKRVGKSVNKKRFGKKSMRKNVNKNKKRNNNRRTKRAGYLKKGLGLTTAAKIGAKGATLSFQNAKAGYDAYKILNNKNLTPEQKFAKGKNIAGDALKNNLNFGKYALGQVVDTDKAKQNLQQSFGLNIGPAQLHKRPAHPQFGKPGVPAGYPQFGQPGQQQRGPFPNIVR